MSLLFRVKIVGFFTALLSLPMVTFAYGPEVWSNLGLYGGSVQSVVIDPSNPERLFAGIWFGEGLFRSVDGAATWHALKMEERAENEDTFENHALLALSLSPTNPNVVWAAHNYWVARSVDAGDTWSHILNSTMQRDCLNCGGSTDNFRFCLALISDPTNSDIAYVGTSGAWSTDVGGAVYRTADGGITWEKLNQGANLDYSVIYLAIDPNTPQIIWATTNSFGAGGVWDGTLYRSTDAGQSWDPIIPDPFSYMELNGVTVHPDDANTVFVTGAVGVARGVFEGEEWRFTHPIPECRQAYGLTFDPSESNIVYVGWKTPVSWGGDGLPRVSRSVDGGLTWDTYKLDEELASLPRTLAVHPEDPDTVYLGDTSGGVLKSRDHGQTWVSVNTNLNGIVVNDVAVDTNDTSHILAATSGGVYERTGTTWKRRLSNNTASVSFVPGSSTAYYAGLWNQLARTQDNGTTWTFSPQIAYGWIQDIAVDPLDTPTLFIADRSHVRRSRNSGDTFEPVLEGQNQAGEKYILNTLAFDPADHNHIFAGGGNFSSPKVLGDLWESMDGGETWQRTGLTDAIVNKVIVDPRDSRILYAGVGYSGGIFTAPILKSMDAGVTWDPAESGLPPTTILLTGVWAETENNVYACGGNRDILHFDGNTVDFVLERSEEQDVLLSDIFGIDAEHIYAVGGNGDIMAFDGSTWSSMQSPTGNFLHDIWGTASTDLFAVGVSGTILHFDGQSWTSMASGISNTLYGLFGTAKDDVFAVGEEGTILHYDGNTWMNMSSPTTNDLYAVWAASADTVFATGSDGTMITYDGSVWSSMNSTTDEDIADIWGRGADDVYAVVDYNGQILHFDGTAWTSSTIPEGRGLSGIWGLPSGILFVVDATGGMYRNNGEQWDTLRLPGSTYRSVTDLAFNSQNPDVLYASTYQAGVFLSPDQAGTWLNLGTPVLAVNAISAGSLYAATNGGLFQLTGTGVLAGDVYDRDSLRRLDDVWVTTDLGIESRTIDGLYMMVLPAGIYNVYASADNYHMGMADYMTVYGAEVTWVDFALEAGLAGMPGGFETEQNITIGNTGSGAYCLIQTVHNPSLPIMTMARLIGVCILVFGVARILSRFFKCFAIGATMAIFFSVAITGPSHAFTIFEQVGLASAPLPVGSGARAQGMGGAFISVADDATAASWNPAGLIQLERPEVSLVGAYVNRSETFSSDTSPEISNTGDVSYSNINYANATFPFHWPKNIVVSLNYQRLFDFKREFQYQRNITTSNVDLNQQIQYDQDGFVSAVGLAGAIEITPRFSLGATVNFWTDQLGYDNSWTEKYDEVAQGTQSSVQTTIHTTIQDDYEQFRGINFNLGLLWDAGKWGTWGAVIKTPFTATIQHRFRFHQTTTYGDPINNDIVIGPITVEEEVELDMPISYGLGWSRRFKDNFTFGIDIYRTEWGDYTLTNSKGEEFSPIDGRPKSQSDVDATTHLRIGAEYLFLIPKHHLVIPARVGVFYDPEPSEGSPNDFYGLALGTGLTFKRCSLDLAYQLRWATDASTGNLIAESVADITQHTLLASVIVYF